MSDPKYKVLEVSGIRMEDGAKELLDSPEMQPYGPYILAAICGGDVDASMREIAALPLEKRYAWRVASALKWGVADFEDRNAVVDRKTPARGFRQTDETSPVSPDSTLHVSEGPRRRGGDGKSDAEWNRRRQTRRVHQSRSARFTATIGSLELHQVPRNIPGLSDGFVMSALKTVHHYNQSQPYNSFPYYYGAVLAGPGANFNLAS
jgi:hypothetical protein